MLRWCMPPNKKALGVDLERTVTGQKRLPLVILDLEEAFATVREEADGKVLAFCRTGTRSITLDALANVENETADARIERAERAGYDLSGLRDRLGE